MASDSRLGTARPAIAIGGRVDSSLTEGMIELTIAESIDGLYHCEAVFGNWGPANGTIDFLYFDRRTLDFGKPFQVRLGTDVLLDARITAIEAQFLQGSPPRITVLAEDRFQDLRMTRRTRTFADMSDAEVMRQICGNHGLTADISVSGGTHKVLAQVKQSDLAFLRERARAVDAELWMDGSTLHVQTHTARRGATLDMTYGASLRQFTVLADLAAQRSQVSINGWDVAAKAAITETADDSSVGGELDGDESGASILRASLSSRNEAVAHKVPFTAAEAKAHAEACFKTMARRFVVGRGLADTDATLRVGTSARLSGLGPLFSGKYYVSEVRHLFDGVGGLRSEFVGERPGIGRA